MGAGLLLAHPAERKAQEVQLFGRGGEQEIALVLARVDGPAQLGSPVSDGPADIVAGREAGRPKIPRGLQQVAELDRLVAADTGDRGFAAQITVGEIVDHAFAEPAFIVEDVMRNPQALGHVAGVVNVLPGAAGAPALDGGAVIVKLQGHANHVIAEMVQQGGGDRTVHASGHRHNHAGGGPVAGKAEIKVAVCRHDEGDSAAPSRPQGTPVSG